MIGRPQRCALAVAGAVGVGYMLRILREELEVTMALTGTLTIAVITPRCLGKINLKRPYFCTFNTSLQ